MKMSEYIAITKINIYDAMTTNRSYLKSKRPFAVLAEMKDKMTNCFNEELLRKFICFLGPEEQRIKIRVNNTLF